MLSFLNNIPTAANGKAGPTGNTVQSAASARDTSGEGTKPFCNGNVGTKKRKKGKQPAPAAKMPKLTNAATIATKTTLIIPKPHDKSKEDEEKDLEIPNMGSPLFKDILPKRVEFSSTLSSSGENTSSSDDSSSSDENYADEEVEKKEMNVSNMTQENELTEESSKLRTPIKLTISNLGKPSATVFSTATLDFITNNFSHSDMDVDMDVDIKDADKKTKLQPHPSSQGKANGDPDSPHASTNSIEGDAHNEQLKIYVSNNLKHIDSVQLQNNSKLTIIDKVVGDIKEVSNDTDLHDNIMLNSTKADKSEENVHEFSSPAAKKNNSGKDNTVSVNLGVNPSKGALDESKNGDLEDEVAVTKQHQGDFLNKNTDSANESLLASKGQLLDQSACIKSKLDLAPLQDGCETKYCPDGFLLSSNLSKSSQHLKVNLSIAQNGLDTNGNKDKKSSCILMAETSSQNDIVNEIDKPDHSNKECKKSKSDIKNNLMQGCELNTSTNKTCLPQDIIQDEITEKIKAEQLFTSEKSLTKQAAIQNLSVNVKETNDNTSDKFFTDSKADESSCETILKNTSVNIARKTGPRCKDTPVSSHSLLKNIATKMTASLTTTNTNSGSIMSPTSEYSVKTSRLTNGIPDSENPFITWTKFDDDDDVDDSYESINASLSASSLVHNLARVPFTLPLARESSIPHISPIHVAVPQLSPLALTGVSPGGGQLSLSPGSQMPLLSSPNSLRMRSSPSHGHAKQQLSPCHFQIIHGCDESKASHHEINKVKPTHKSGKRTSRLSNIIDSLRTSKEKQAANASQIFDEQSKKGFLDTSAGDNRMSPPFESSLSIGQKSASSSPMFSVPLGSDHRLSNENIFCDSLGFPHQFSSNADHLIRASLDAARAQSIDKSFNVLKDGLDKGKRILESLETRNGILDPYSKSDARSLKTDNSNSQNRSKSSSSVFSTSTAISTAPSKPSSHQSTKSSNQTYPSASPSLPSSRPSIIASNTSNNLSTGTNINSPMFHLAPSAALAAAHLELNAAAANILTFQHMYGIPDPYMMKTLMSNPLYLQRMMEYQKQAMDPVMLRQIEMFEAAAAAENSKNSKEQQAAMNAHSILWQAQAASILQHQQMQQIQQLQLHHQHQQLQQQVAAARERENIAAIMTSKNSLITPSNKSSGSISTGPSAKSLMSSASTTSSMTSSYQSSSKRARPVVTPSSMDILSKDAPSLEKKFRTSHQTSSHISNHNSFNSSIPPLNTASLSLFRHAHLSNKPSSNNSSSAKTHTSSSTASQQLKREYLNFPTALQLSSAASPHLWGYPTLLQPASLEMAHMAQFYEQAGDAQALSLAVGSAESEVTGDEVLNLSVKPKT